MRVFISHTNADADLARTLVTQLSEQGIEVWDPGEQILPGDNWALKIGQALKESRAMIVLLSPDSMKSESVRREIQYALGDRNYAGRVFPVMVRPTEEVPWILNRFRMLRTNNPAIISKHISEQLIKGTQAHVSPSPTDQPGAGRKVTPPQPSESLILLRRDNNKLRKQVAKLEAALKRRGEKLRTLEDPATELQRDMAKPRSGKSSATPEAATNPVSRADAV